MRFGFWVVQSLDSVWNISEDCNFPIYNDKNIDIIEKLLKLLSTYSTHRLFNTIIHYFCEETDTLTKNLRKFSILNGKLLTYTCNEKFSILLYDIFYTCVWFYLNIYASVRKVSKRKKKSLYVYGSFKGME